jgi:hypothetical protein
MSRFEFYSSTLIELKIRIFGYVKRVFEFENVGTRRLYGLIHSGFTSLGGGRQLSEQRLWPMKIDKIGKVKNVPKSEEMVKRDRDLILKIWPDAIIRE